MAAPRDFEDLQRRCTRTSALLDDIEPEVVSWGVHKEKLHAPWQLMLRRYADLVGRFPEDWHDATASQFVAGRVLTAPERTRKFLRAAGDVLPAEQIALVRQFAREPWFYCLFRILKHEQGEFFTILDLDTGEERLLCSGAVRSLERTGVKLFLALVFSNQSCLQTFGPVRYYRGFQPYDFHYFARLLDPTRLQEEGLSAVIGSNPGSFFLLDGWTEIPPVAHGRDLVEVCAAELPLDSFDLQRYGGRLQIEEAQGLVCCRLKGERHPLRLAAAYYDASTRRLAVQASTPDLYGKLREVLGPEVPLPERPPWRATVTMSIAAREIQGKEDPASPYTRRFEGEASGESTPEKQEQLDRINALLRQLTDHGNRGTPYSLQALAAGQGVDLETARRLEELVKRQGAALEIQIEGGLSGYVPPPPVARERFRLSPWDSGLFTFLDSPRVRGLYAELLPAIQERCQASMRIQGAVGPAPEDLGHLGNWLADLYDETQEQEDFTLLNTAFDLLCHRGERLEPVRDYAVEVLRLFWQVLLPGREEEHVRRFHGRFARFAYDVLYSGGLVEIDPPVNRLEARQGAYSIRPSAFFRAWVRHRESRGAQTPPS